MPIQQPEQYRRNDVEDLHVVRAQPCSQNYAASGFFETGFTDKTGNGFCPDTLRIVGENWRNGVIFAVNLYVISPPINKRFIYLFQNFYRFSHCSIFNSLKSCSDYYCIWQLRIKVVYDRPLLLFIKWCFTVIR